MSSIAIYCKECGKMFFVTCDAADRDTAREIAKYLEQGHTLKSDVPTEKIRREFGVNKGKCSLCQSID